MKNIKLFIAMLLMARLKAPESEFTNKFWFKKVSDALCSDIERKLSQYQRVSEDEESVISLEPISESEVYVALMTQKQNLIYRFEDEMRSKMAQAPSTLPNEQPARDIALARLFKTQIEQWTKLNQEKLGGNPHPEIQVLMEGIDQIIASPNFLNSMD